MAIYQVLARRYRPQKFSDVCGQQPIIDTLKNGIRLGRLSHAYLFHGPRGVGKTTLARILSKAINCEKQASDQEPCNLCKSCQEITKGSSLDVLEIDGASNRGIDDIRQLNDNIGYAPSFGKYRVYIIDEVHMLTKEAFNALLKTLEEPPPSVKFLFATTEVHKMPMTVLSRCQSFALHRITPKDLVAALDKIVLELNLSIEKEGLYCIAKLADGSLRDAQSLLDQVLCFASSPVTTEAIHTLLHQTNDTFFDKLDEAVDQCQARAAFELAEELYKEGVNFESFLNQLAHHYRDLLAILCKHPLPFLSPSQKEHKIRQSRIYDLKTCASILEYLLDQINTLSKVNLTPLHIEMLLIHIIRTKKTLSSQDLVQRLLDLEGRILAADPCNDSPGFPQKTSAPPPSSLPLDQENSNPSTSVSPSRPDTTIDSHLTANPSAQEETLMRFASIELGGRFSHSE